MASSDGLALGLPDGPLLGDVEGWLLGLPDGLVLLGMKAGFSPWIKKWTRCQ